MNAPAAATARPARPRRARGPLIRPALLTLLLLVLATSPSFLIMLFDASSLALGVTVSSVLILAIVAWRGRRRPISIALSKRRATVLAAILGALVLHGLVAKSITGFFDWTRALSSLALIALILATALVLRDTVALIPPRRLVNVARACFAVFVVEGLLAVVGVPSIRPSYHHEPIIFFMEPSHYSLSLLPFMTFLVMCERGTLRLAVVFVTLAIGVMVQSMSLLVGLIVVVALMFPLRRLLLVAVLAVPVFLAVDASYFLDRLAFGEDVDNLSVLAFLQGWERAWLNFQGTHGVGVGFQQFGLVGDLGFFQERIEQLFDLSGLNLLDGGTNGSKMVGEFGAIGVLGLLAYLGVMLFAASLAKRRPRPGADTGPTHVRFYCACIVAAFTEFFVRGDGYMTPGMLLLGCGLMWWFPRYVAPWLARVAQAIVRWRAGVARPRRRVAGPVRVAIDPATRVDE